MSADQVGMAGEFARLAALGDWDAAVELARHHFGIEREAPALFPRISALLLDKQMIDAAEDYLQQGCLRWPDDVWLPWHNAKLADRYRGFEIAEARWRDMMARRPDSPLGLCGLAELFRNSGREQEAAEMFAEAAVRYPDYVWAIAGHAHTATLRHDWPEAATLWAAVRDRFPELLRAHEQLAYVLIEGGCIAEAMEAVRRGLAAFPRSENLKAAFASIEERSREVHPASGDGDAKGDTRAGSNFSEPVVPSMPPGRTVPFSILTSKVDALRMLSEAQTPPEIGLPREKIGDFLEHLLEIGGPISNVDVNLISAAESQGREKTVFEASVRRLAQPLHLSGRPECFPPVGGENAYRPALKVLAIPNGIFCNFAECSVIFSADGKSIIQDYSSMYGRLVQFYDVDVNTSIAEAVHVDGTAIVLPDDIRPLNFCHWMVDWLPRLAFLGSHTRRSDCYVLISPMTAPFQIETLQMCGFERNRIIEVENFQAVRARELLITNDARNIPHPAFKAAPWAVAYLQSTIGLRSLLSERNTSSGFPKKLYISRADARGRRVANEEELYAVLRRLGYIKIVLSELTLREQVALFVGATHVVGIHGAGFAHFVFLTQPSTVVEIFPATHGTPAFYILAAGLENRYASYLVNNVVATGGTKILSDFDVIMDVADFEQRCADLL